MILNKEQQEAVDELNDFIRSSDTEIKLLGKAGTGKTSLIAEFVKTLKLKIAIVTLSHKAKAVIRSKIPNADNIHFHTTASLLNMKLNMETGDFSDEGNNPIIQNYNLIINDECSMSSKESLALIRKKKLKKCKIIHVGDFRQLPPIGEKESALVKEIMIPKIELTERVRQGQGNTILDFSDIYGDAALNNTKVDIIRANSDNVKFYNSFNTVLKDYEKEFKNCINDTDAIKVVCYRNAVKKATNSLIREVIFGKAMEIPYLPGDVIIMDNNYQNLENSQELLILEANQLMEGNYLIYKIKAIKTNSYDKAEYYLYVLDDFSVPYHAKDVADMFDKYKKTKDKKVLTEAWNLKQKYALVSHNFCCSAHRSQGSSYRITVVLEDDIMKSFMSQKEKYQCMYTAITRSSEKTIIVKQ